MLAYWGYCVFWGIRGSLHARTATDYFIAGRKLPGPIFVLAATATCYSGWSFFADPGQIYTDGFPSFIYPHVAAGPKVMTPSVPDDRGHRSVDTERCSGGTDGHGIKRMD